MSSCEKKLNEYVNLKRTVGYQSTIIGEFACYISMPQFLPHN